ncbi:bifunctional metallophosphatase/5'-nucleotidase [Pyxidicoccus parkwayensis]|uniref:Bifunctional metallophosphatase/5'-nucleotidase n=1 Tax=Pyxidicoccus parkwayensis TaxID=2813578 RepID=A0ABX7P016_9BACT|nr:bifunctional metallophosphatase/5'-nucleotidase [Pyxidicoccus parkwaysis]QSQ22981.1 bifunctional metallophosphatase/5'-nucleotidase [Pyxidicoccus parkwaysis]
MQPTSSPRRLGARPGTFLLAGAFVTGMLLFTHAGCGSTDCETADDCQDQNGNPSTGQQWVCINKTCETRSTETDAGTRDAGSDSGVPDSGIPDSGTDAGTVSVQILAFNDFHGQLEAPAGSGGQIQVGVLPDGGPDRVNAGGVTYFAKHIQDLRETNPNTVVVSAGDLIGATPLLSALFHDEPTIEAMNKIGIDLVAVGNHEFDEGSPELLRMQTGGCHPVDGCQDGDGFEGARFKYLAANVATAADRTLFPRYDIRTFEGVKIAFIGMTLEGTPEIVTPTYVSGLSFKDEVETVNKLVPELKQQGVRAIVVVVHEGGVAATGALVNECKGTGTADGLISGAIVDIAKGIDNEVDVIVSGHTHNAYNCSIGGKLVTSAASVGRLVTDIDLKLDRTTGDVVEAKANNVIVTRTVTEDTGVKDLVAKYQARATPLANRVIGYVAATLMTPGNQKDPAGQSTMGFVIADAQLAATKPANMGGAQIAFMNPGGVRADIVEGEVTYGEAFTTQPFGNSLVTLTLTGAQIEAVLERQWQQSGSAVITRILQPSAGFSYTFDANQPIGSRIDPATIRLDGQVIDPAADYRVTVNSFLATGGDGFAPFNEGRNRLGGAVDTDALENYLKNNSSQGTPLPAPALDRITAILPPPPAP